MQKIPTLFLRNHATDHLVRDAVTPGCEWVFEGDMTPTVKYDGSCCLVRGGRLYRRYEAKVRHASAGEPEGGLDDAGERFAYRTTPPAGFEPSGGVDRVTLKQTGWVPVGGGPDDRYHMEAFQAGFERGFPNGTYELCGPKVNGNPERLKSHTLLRHGSGLFKSFTPFPPSFSSLKFFLQRTNVEGVVFYRRGSTDMCKIKVRDYGLTRVHPSTPA